MDTFKFENKWKDINENKSNDEFSLFVAPGGAPLTQRQINLYWYHRLFQNIIKEKKIKTGLELGSGRGTMSLYLNKYNGIETTLLDISPEAAELAKKNFEGHNAQGRFEVGSCEAIPFPNESFDIVYSIGLLEHLDNYKKTIEESFRVLRPGGVMIALNIPGKWSVQNINNWYKKILEFFTGKKYPAKDYYRNNDKPADYRKVAEEAGFKNLSVINVNPFPIFVPVRGETDKKIAKIYNLIIKARLLFMPYPFKTNYIFSQGHFLIGYK
ncbi:MAG: methyltransferase domain-containing protein [Patescibacteria group bacterium]